METKGRASINITYDGVDYTLQYTPYSVRKMEDEGFDFNKIGERVVNIGYDLFSGAFIAKHDYVPRKLRDTIYEETLAVNDDGQNLVETLSTMLKDELDYIASKPRGNVKWTVAK